MEFISEKEKTIIQISMADMMNWIKVFVRPLLEGTMKVKWNPEKGIWI